MLKTDHLSSSIPSRVLPRPSPENSNSIHRRHTLTRLRWPQAERSPARSKAHRQLPPPVRSEVRPCSPARRSTTQTPARHLLHNRPARMADREFQSLHCWTQLASQTKRVGAMQTKTWSTDWEGAEAERSQALQIDLIDLLPTYNIHLIQSWEEQGVSLVKLALTKCGGIMSTWEGKVGNTVDISGPMPCNPMASGEICISDEYTRTASGRLSAFSSIAQSARDKSYVCAGRNI